MRDARVYLLHIRDAIQKVFDYTAAGRQAFFDDSKTQDAVVRNLEIVGEAAKNVSDAVRAAHPNIPWKELAGMREKMIHQYFGVDLKLVWDVVERELPALKRSVDEIIADQ